MRRHRSPLAALLVLAAALGLGASHAHAGDISGELTLGNGSGYSHATTVTVHAPATSTVPIETVALVDGGGFLFYGPIPYTDTFTVDLSAFSMVTLGARWTDADGATYTSPAQVLSMLDFAPDFSIQWVTDEDPADGTIEFGINTNGAPGPVASFSVNGTTWGADIVPETTADAGILLIRYPLFDPVYGGKATLGSRTIHMRIRDAGDAWSPDHTRNWLAAVDTTIAVSPAQPVTGHLATFTPQYPGTVGFPAGTSCTWEFMWGDPQSLYYGNRDDTFGFFYTVGPKSGGHCGPRSFTMPAMPYPRMLVHFEAQAPDGETIAEAWIGASPDAPAVVPVQESTDRHITQSNIPMVYVLPDDYILELGASTTYHAISVGGAPIDGGTWSADFAGDAYDRQRIGGTSFTFTPQVTGFVTVCWGSDTTRATRWSACYDPPVKRRDLYRPVATVPVEQITPATVPGGTIPTTISWSGTDRGWGIARFQVERRVDGGSWVRVVNRLTRTYATTLSPAHAYAFRVRAIDKYGNVGAWVTGPAFRPGLVEDTAAAVVYTGDWTDTADATARGGQLHEASTAAAEASLTFSARDVAWIAERGPGHGTAQVFVDDVLVATIDLGADATTPARVVFRRHFAAKATHTLRVVVEGTVDRPVVGVDGFALLR